MEEVAMNSLRKRERRPSVRLGEIGDMANRRRRKVVVISGDQDPSLQFENERGRRKSLSEATNKEHVEDDDGVDQMQIQTPEFKGSGLLASLKSSVKKKKLDWPKHVAATRKAAEVAKKAKEKRRTLHAIHSEGKIPEKEKDEEEFGNNIICEQQQNFLLPRFVRKWLQGRSLVKYAELFEFHEVDEQVLPMLTMEDLRDMGIVAVGARRKLYQAIQQLA